MNKTQVQHTSVKRNVQIELASSRIEPCSSHPTILETEPSIPKESLFKNKKIISGSIITAMAIIAIIPQELFINDILVETVRRASFIDAPTIGTKLLIAKRAVFIDKESTP